MSRFLLLLAGTAMILGATAAQASDFGIKVGVLTCQVESGWGFVVGSSKDMDCVYRPVHGADDRYVGTIWKLGLDLGYTESGTIVWDVVAPSSDSGPGALSGNYGGATASATVVVGVGVNALIGGFDKSVALQPVSVIGNAGFDVAAGIGAMRLKEAMPEPAPARPAALAPPPPLASAPRSFTVFFAFNDDGLDPVSRAVVREAASAALERRGPHLSIMVFGNTDTVGSYRYNDVLSDRRAATVKAELVRNGLDPSVVGTAGHSFDDQRVETDPGVRERLNRRAVIVIRSDVES
jgi:outer membrane protein OmpA-like peptidoglycan-associated protein